MTLLSIITKPFKREDKLDERITRYVSPRQIKVDCSINNEIHSRLKKEVDDLRN